VEEVGKERGRVSIAQYCVHMYVNGKMRPVETASEMGGGEIKNINYDIFDIL
jgi:hypothetical protein